jgi:electron-transferring-flavoprotein dehydrogenase
MQLLEAEPALAESFGEVPVAIVEKGRSTGSHLLSGAMVEPSAMRRLFPTSRSGRGPSTGWSTARRSI